MHLGRHRRDVLAPLRPILAGATGIVNLEGPVGTGDALLVNDEASLRTLRAAGVGIVGVANNHMNDLGPASVANTIAAVSRAGLRSAPATLGSVVVTAHDLTNGVPATLADDLRVARGRVLIATFHVTAPPLYSIASELREAVDIAVAAGASVVAAHGTHQLAKVERRGKTVIAWGLGNLVFDCPCTRERDGLILRARIEGNRVTSARILPIDAGLDGEPARPAENAALTYALLEKLGSSKLSADGLF